LRGRYEVISLFFAVINYLHAFVVEQIGEHQRNYKVLQIKNIGIEHLKEKGLLI
jgi:hypothetical protein